MKTIVSLFLVLFLISSLVTAQDTLYIYKTGSIITKYALADIDSITFKVIPPTIQVPVLTTTAVGSITQTTATSGGTITSDGGATITISGVCWSTNINPTTANSKTTDGTSTGSFSTTLTGLTANTTYYVRSYAINSKGTSYGNEISFTTNIILSIATLTTTIPNNITSNSATLGGNISDDGNASVTERGVCYSTNASPTVTNNKVSVGSGMGSFSSSITGLLPNTTYFVRAYAINSQGIAYGDAAWFKTSNVLSLATVSTTDPTTISESSALLGGNVSEDGNAPVTEKGICYSTSPNPTTDNNKVSCGSETGSFNLTITGLLHDTIYYVRAYAINSQGTAYGNEVSFRTIIVLSLATVTTSVPIAITLSSVVLRGDVTKDGNAQVTIKGFCYSTNQNPTTENNKLPLWGGIGVFTKYLNGLIPNTTYYVRAYASNSQGTAYGDEFNFTTQKVNESTVTDIDGNVYHMTTIGTQTWMVENLKTTKYNDNTDIPNVTEGTAWAALTTPAYCWYNNDVTNKTTYGALYNWYTVNTNKLCPIGWHVPSNAEWTILTNYLYGDSMSGAKLKEKGTTHWDYPNISADNSTGFTALPGGWRSALGPFYSKGFNGYWYTANGTHWNMDTDHTDIYHGDSHLNGGNSVRCLLNN